MYATIFQASSFCINSWGWPRGPWIHFPSSLYSGRLTSLCASPPTTASLFYRRSSLSSASSPPACGTWDPPCGFFGMLRQNNLAPPSHSQFDRSRHTCRGDIIQAPPGLLVIRWSKTHQTITSSQVLPIPSSTGPSSRPGGCFSLPHCLLAFLLP